MARPNWEYIRVDVRVARHRKLDGLTPATLSAVIGTLVQLWCHCGEEHTDGFVRDSVWNRTGTPAARKLLAERGFACRGGGGWQMHDYCDWNRSLADILARSAQGSAAGKRSAASRQRSVERTVERAVDKSSTEAEAEAEAEADLSRAEVNHQSSGSNPAEPRPDLIDLIISEIHTATSHVVTPDWAAQIAAHVLQGRSPTDPAAYLRQVIRSERDPRKRFLPVAESAPPADWPPWCGECDERTRQAGPPDEPHRCLACHPLIRRATPQGATP